MGAFGSTLERPYRHTADIIARLKQNGTVILVVRSSINMSAPPAELT